jgi:spore coat polysaccharide biosynthesis protein SpsF (cytidylyltransferase family)
MEVEADLSKLRWTVDYQADLEFVRRIYEALYPANPEFGTVDVLNYLVSKGEIRVFDRTGLD